LGTVALGNGYWVFEVEILKEYKMIKSLEDFKAYNLAMEIGEQVWDIVKEWNYFEKDTIGKQLVRAFDSIAANLSEGLGRYHYREAKNFAYYSRGSLFETKTWVAKAGNRDLITQERFLEIQSNLEILGKMINSYIKTIGSNTNSTTPNA
jgi:four helix bundle protein